MKLPDAHNPDFSPIPDRPSLFVVCNSLPPYRVHLHRRFVTELADVQVWSVCTHDSAADRWAFDPPPEINPVRFGPEEESATQNAPKRTLHEFAKGGRIIRWMKARKPRAVLLNGYNDAGRLRIIRWCHAAGVPCFVWGDSNIKGDHSAGAKLKIKRAVLGWMTKHVSALLPCGSLGAAFFKKYGATDAQVFYSPVEPDYGLIETLPTATIDATAARFRITPGRRRIIYSGRLAPEKRVDLAIAAFAAVAAERPDWDLWLIGDGALRGTLEASVPAEMRQRVRFFGFQQDQAVVSALYRLGDVLILPSDYEPWALVVNEGVAAGLAVVSSDVVGASAELVRPGVNGALFPAGDLDALVAALRTVTAAGSIDRLKAGSAGVLADWRRVADPVEGVRRALARFPASFKN